MMTFESRAHRFGIIALALIALVALSFAMVLAEAQEPTHTALGLQHRTYISVESLVLDAKKLEAKAISILRKKDPITGVRMPLAEAQAKVRVDAEGRPDAKGRTDIARCLEFVFTDDLQSTLNVSVVAIAVANQHPTAPLE